MTTTQAANINGPAQQPCQRCSRPFLLATTTTVVLTTMLVLDRTLPTQLQQQLHSSKPEALLALQKNPHAGKHNNCCRKRRCSQTIQPHDIVVRCCTKCTYVALHNGSISPAAITHTSSCPVSSASCWHCLLWLLSRAPTHSAAHACVVEHMQGREVSKGLDECV